MKPMVTDWIMVVITAIYVIATICITKSNKESASASKEQLKESIKQFDEMRRLSSLPFLQLELNGVKDRATDYIIELPINKGAPVDLFSQVCMLRNIGNGTAMNVVYSWECKEYEITNIDYPPVNAIRYGDSYKVELLISKTEANEKTTGVLTFSYQDLVENEYKQAMYLSCIGYDIAIDTDVPRLVYNPD